MDGAKVSTNSITSKQLEPHITPKLPPISLDPLPFRDPEHECHNIIAEDGQLISPSPLKTRFLSNKEANRLWGLATVPSRQTQPDSLNLDSRSLDTVPTQQTGSGAFSNSSPRSNPAVPAHPPVQHALDTVVQTSAVVLPPRPPYPKLTGDTPHDRRILEFVLDYRLDPGPGLRDLWVHSMISRMLTWVDPLGLRLHPTPPSDYKPLPLLIIRDTVTDTLTSDDRFEHNCGIASGFVSICAQRGSRNELAGAFHHPTTSTLGLSSRAAATSAMIGTSLISKPSSAGPSSTDVAVRKTRRGGRRKSSTTTPPPSPLVYMGEPNSQGVQLESTLRECTAGTFPGEEIISDPDDLTGGKTMSTERTISSVDVSPVPVSDAFIIAGILPLPDKVPTLGEANTHVERPDYSGGNAGIELESIHTLSQRREFSDQRSHATKAHAPPKGGIWVFVTRGQGGRLVADRSSLQLPSSGDHHGGKTNITCTARCLVNIGLAGVVSVRLPTVAAPTEDTQVITASNYNEPALVHHRRRRRHRNLGIGIKPHSMKLVADEHTAVIRVAPAPLQYSDPNIESWRERRENRRGTGGSPSRSDGNNGNGPPISLMSTHPPGGYPSENSSEASFGEPHSSAYAPSTEVRADMGGSLHPDSNRCNADCSVPRCESESPAQSVLGDYQGDSTTPTPVPASVEVLLEKGGRKCTFELRKSDWDDAHAQGMSEHSDIVIGLAWRRSVMTQRGQRVTLPTIRLVSREVIDLPKNSWPTSWEGLVEHVNTGGFFRSIPTLRGGMNPEMQALLDSTVFDDPLQREAIDRDLNRFPIEGSACERTAAACIRPSAACECPVAVCMRLSTACECTTAACTRPATAYECTAAVCVCPATACECTVVNSGAKLVEIRRHIYDDKGRSPIFLYLDFPSIVAAQRLTAAADHDAIPPEVQLILFSQLAERSTGIYTSKVTAEVLAGVDEKTIRALGNHAAAHPCPAAVGAGAAAGVPDNPDAVQH